MKRLSVIIPGYNTPDAWWRRCIASVLVACGENDEVICVDDGSSTPVVFSEISRDSRLRFVRLEKNSGLASARNAALEIAQGECVTFVDSDDEVRSETFSRCMEMLSSTGSDICMYGVDVIWTADGLRKHDVPEKKCYGKMSPSDVKRLYDGCLFNYSCNKVYRLAFLNSNGLRFNKDGMPCEDIIFNLECLMTGATWCAVDYEGYVYYRGAGTLVSNYQRSFSAGTRLCAETWARYCCTSQEAKELFSSFGDLSEASLAWQEWTNIWRPRTPCTLRDKWNWLKSHSELLGVRFPFVAFVKKGLYMTLRRWLYIRPIRVWHLKRVFPNIVNYKDVK